MYCHTQNIDNIDKINESNCSKIYEIPGVVKLGMHKILVMKKNPWKSQYLNQNKFSPRKILVC